MATKISNSLSTYLEQSMILERNSIEVISKINDAMSSNKDNVFITITNPDNPEETKTYKIPSFGYLKRCINRIDATLETLMNVNGNTNSLVKLPDGSYKKIITANLPSEAPTITEVNKVTNFRRKANWFFEDLLNPCLYISIDLTGKIPVDTERIMIQRFMINCDDSTDGKKGKQFFEEKWNNHNDIDYITFVNTIIGEGIRFILDDEIKNIPPRNKRYSGVFKIRNISLPTTDYNNKITKVYELNTLEYTDNRASENKTCILKTGDFLEVNTYPSNTRYRVRHVEDGTNNVILELVEGVYGLKIGSELKISSELDTSISIDIPVGSDEREIVFIKPIDPHSNIPAENWSPGIGFFTNNLTYTDYKNNVHKLKDYYQNHVVDYGQVILSYAKDYYPTIREAIEPNPVKLFNSNFTIVDINEHLRDGINYEEIEKLLSEKITLGSEVENLSYQITEQRKYIEESEFSSQEDEDKEYEKLKKLVDKQNLYIIDYNSHVNIINAKTSNLDFIKPEYRVRGFWEMPDSVVSKSSGVQQVIGFRIRYRYLSNNGTEPKELIIPITSDKSNTITAKFSNWNEYMSKRRERIYNEDTKEYAWKNIDLSNPDEVKPNQCDIPIHFGEKVEIQIKSISEAGWPSNPIESKTWSNSVVISFDNSTEIQYASLLNMIQQNRADLAVINYNTIIK